MGYKLAGFDVIGGVDIDPEMMAIYRKNHEPRHSYLMGVQEFKSLHDLPKELFELGVLDGSPPCSSFSMAGSREDAWGKEKKFREGQANQVLDDLFFHFIDIAERLKPKIVVAENVKGLVAGKARGYVKEIFRAFEKAGYDSQLFLLNSSRMGVPQARERTFFVARRKDLFLPIINLSFNEPAIPVGFAVRGCLDSIPELLTPGILKYWSSVPIGKNFSSVTGGKLFSWRKCNPATPSSTITATHCLTHWSEPRLLSGPEVSRIQSFPDDYDFGKSYAPYVCGMSVPPLMMQRVATEIAKLLLNNKT
jgi:DNA (cytosine-5)-methyltransferase 1